MNASTWAIIGAILAADLLLGLVLLIRGLRGRRVGAEPRCRRCGYDLTGGAGERCPECGAALDRPRAVVQGRRRARRTLVIVGGALWIATLAVLIGGFVATRTGFNWRGYVPSAVLIVELRSDPLNAAAAQAELHRRWKAATLGAGDIERIADVALRVQAAPDQGIAASNLIEWLGEMHAAGQLKPAQSQRIGEQAVANLVLLTRPVVLKGWAFPVRVRFEMRAPSRWQIGVAVPKLYGDRGFWSTSGTFGGVGTGTLLTSVALDDLGQQKLEGTVQISITDAGGVKVCQFEQPVRTGVEVTDALPENLFELRHSPDADAWFRNHVTLRASSSLGGGVTFNVHTNAGAPLAGSFDLLVRCPQGETKVSMVHISGGGNGVQDSAVAVSLPPGCAPPYDVVLRATLRAAHAAPDGSSFWSGELWFKDVTPRSLLSARTFQPVDEMRRVGEQLAIWRRPPPPPASAPSDVEPTTFSEAP